MIWNLWDSDNTEKSLTCFIPCDEEVVVYRRHIRDIYTRGVFSFFFVLIFLLFHDVIPDGGVGGNCKGLYLVEKCAACRFQFQAILS